MDKIEKIKILIAILLMVLFFVVFIVHSVVVSTITIANYKEEMESTFSNYDLVIPRIEVEKLGVVSKFELYSVEIYCDDFADLGYNSMKEFLMMLESIDYNDKRDSTTLIKIIARGDIYILNNQDKSLSKNGNILTDKE